VNRRIAFAVFCILHLSACAVDHTTAPPTAGSGAARNAAAESNAEALVEQAIEEQRLKELGVQPGTKKAAIMMKWHRMIREAPDLKAAFPAGIPPSQTPQGQVVFADGMMRVTPAKRAEFWSLYARVAAAHLPDDCYGQASSTAISSRLMAFPNLTDEDTDEYLGLVVAMLHASAQHAPEHVPTPAERMAASTALGKLMMTEVKSKADADHLARVLVNRSAASIADACWVTKVSIRAIDRLPPDEKDVLLASAYHQAVVAAAAAAAPASSAAPAPGSRN